ncbi:MAG: ABC transporter permease [Acidimicrobiales bacterium]|nr:ABC transporter permease [Acidimicrobiales bacterium]
MFLAFHEIRRGPVRFSLLALAIGLLLFLVLFQQAIQNGLITSFVGALRNQSAPVVVFSLDGQRTLQGSTVSDDIDAKVREVEGVDAVARAGQGTFTVTIGGGDATDASILGTDDPGLGRPSELSGGRRAEAEGEAVGSEADFEVGDEVSVVASGDGEAVVLTVVGVARDVQLSVEPTLFTDLATYEASVRAVNPQAPVVPVNGLFVRPADGVDPAELADRINEAAPDADAVTREEAARTAPGVAQIRQSFQIIFALYGMVVPLVTGLFFLIVTLQKARSLTLLRAIGARTGVLATALVTQVLAVTFLGVIVGIGLYRLVTSGGELSSLTVRFDPALAIGWGIGFLVLAVVGSLASLRRVLRIDPMDATTGAGT